MDYRHMKAVNVCTCDKVMNAPDCDFWAPSETQWCKHRKMFQKEAHCIHNEG
jgi:hypothetical protein